MKISLKAFFCYFKIHCNSTKQVANKSLCGILRWLSEPPMLIDIKDEMNLTMGRKVKCLLKHKIHLSELLKMFAHLSSVKTIICQIAMRSWKLGVQFINVPCAENSQSLLILSTKILRNCNKSNKQKLIIKDQFLLSYRNWTV